MYIPLSCDETYFSVTMASFSPSCDICQNLHMTKPAIAWCFECDEAICDDCEKKHGIQKATRHHNATSIDDYQKLPSSISNIRQECEDHNKKMNFYCSTHIEPCCVSCISAKHKNCRELTDLSEIAKGVKYSTEFVDLKERVKDVSLILEELTQSKIDQKLNLHNMKQTIDYEVERIRKVINCHLDKLQNKFSELLVDKELQQRNIIDSLIGELSVMKSYAAKISDELQITEQHASEFQTFLNIKKWSKEIEDIENYLKYIQKSKDLGSVKMYMELCPILETIETTVTEFGKVSVKIQKTTEIVLQKEKQGQTLIPAPRITNINLTKICSLRVSMGKHEVISGCDMLEDESVLVSVDSNTFPRIVVMSPNVSNMKLIPLTGYPCDITAIENNTVAVTLYLKKEIVIVDIDSSSTLNSIPVNDHCYGITYTTGKLVVSLQNQIIQTMDLFGNVLIKISTTSTATYCTMFEDQLYYAAVYDDVVYSCNLNGDVLWEFNCKELSKPHDITNDAFGNIFVTCEKSNKVILIGRRGNQYRVLLGDQDGMFEPRAIHYNRKTCELWCVIQRVCVSCTK
ncbi:unnamed protein product [Mytilus coruscus]|uniref:B box-type domain-containing protein n=1 Tax=Mytilus coruscus TaxID=42192 RepID=A0A6J8E572_MYTCO|nr:unnamed protein product [Mytilus coruscus]